MDTEFNSCDSHCDPESYITIAPGYPQVTVDNKLLVGSGEFRFDEVEVFAVSFP